MWPIARYLGAERSHDHMRETHGGSWLREPSEAGEVAEAVLSRGVGKPFSGRAIIVKVVVRVREMP